MRVRWRNLNPSLFHPLSASHRTLGIQAGIWPGLRLSGKLASICYIHWNMVKSFPGIQGFKSLQTRVKTLRWLSTRRTWNYHVARTQRWLIPVPREGVIWNQLRSTPQHPKTWREQVWGLNGQKKAWRPATSQGQRTMWSTWWPSAICEASHFGRGRPSSIVEWKSCVRTQAAFII